ncbi:hypothetical protein SELMODRAFT_408655 [Selaginella moellendorffii]|uniref:Uncharacterized protein n=1 Tax=Selaginella moellendorffii TaxID=88036 RepID=D8R9I4_SELML|nr:uncharacterized protein LOC9632628 [Selaginella moellendorffii]EFJ31159.1 hypothetical protein SELMODRAFT_408655 [Selaginella moellendorffii]|eukprot:XP_002967812.1 uncharacterized protein LOC9632628 [Selaginella moellendorffii]
MGKWDRIDTSSSDDDEARTHEAPPTLPYSTTSGEGEMIQCVRVFCKRGPGLVSSEAVVLNTSHPIFSSAPVSPVSKLIKLPLRVFQVDPLPNPLGHPLRGLYENQGITYLMIQPDSGFAPLEYQDGVGTAVVARDDRKPLYEKHLEAVLMFLSHLLDLYSEGDFMVPQRKMTRSGFGDFFQSYKRSRALLDQAWELLDSPFED